MSQEVTTAFVKQYTDGVRLLQQQEDARLKAAVMVDSTVVGDRAFFDQMDATAMNEVTNRHGDTEYTDTPHRRRMVTLKTYEVADLVDRADQRRLLNNPVNGYTRSMAAAANRRCDDIIIAAFDASASTGVDGATAVAFPSAFQYDNATDGSLLISDLTQVRNLLEAAENMEDDGEHSWHMVLDSASRRLLLNETEVQSADYNSVKALVNGQINTFLGFNFHKSQRLVTSGSTVTAAYAWVKSSMQLAVSQEPRGFIDVLPQKRHSMQVRYEMDAGATRMDEKGVVQFNVDISA